MKSLAIIGFAVGTVVAGCASTSGALSEPTAGTAAAPAHHYNHHRDGDEAAMMKGKCPMQVSGTTVASVDVEGGIGLSFTTTAGDVGELRKRVRGMAEMHNQPGGHMMASHSASAPGADAEHQHCAQAVPSREGGGRGDMMTGGGMKMPATTASSEDIGGGARFILHPKDPSQLGALRQHVRMKEQRMAAGGECPMMSLGSGGESAPANPGHAGHDAHHPTK
ncbi:MAG: hypothetical protein RJA21_313 [Gemmatimonadota bacterium]